MKITELINIIGIPQKLGVKFTTYLSGQKPKGQVFPLAVFGTELVYWNEATVWSWENDNDSSDFRYKAERLLENCFTELSVNYRKRARYYAIYLILTQINNLLRKKSEPAKQDIESYAVLLENRIQESLEFTDIPAMLALQDIVRTDALFRELVFSVNETQSIKQQQNRSYVTKKRYSFGNKKYYEKNDVVLIQIYDDCGYLWHQSTGQCCNMTFNLWKGNQMQILTAEQKILKLLDNWKNDYLK